MKLKQKLSNLSSILQKYDRIWPDFPNKVVLNDKS